MGLKIQIIEGCKNLHSFDRCIIDHCKLQSNPKNFNFTNLLKPLQRNESDAHKGEERERKKGKGQKFSVYVSTKLKGVQPPPSHIFYIGEKNTRLKD